MGKKGIKKLKNKEKRKEGQTQNLGEFLEQHGIEQLKVKEVTTTDGTKKTVTLATGLEAPKADYDVTIDEETLKSGPPYILYVGNVAFECGLSDVLEHFSGLSMTHMQDPESSFRPRKGGFYFKMDDLDEFTQALRKNGTRIKGREINCEVMNRNNLGGNRDYNFGRRTGNVARYQLMLSDPNGDTEKQWKSDNVLRKPHQDNFGGGNKADLDSDWRLSKTAPNKEKNDHLDRYRNINTQNDLNQNWIDKKKSDNSKRILNNPRHQNNQKSFQTGDKQRRYNNSYAADESPENWIHSRNEYQKGKEQNGNFQRKNVHSSESGGNSVFQISRTTQDYFGSYDKSTNSTKNNLAQNKYERNKNSFEKKDIKVTDARTNGNAQFKSYKIKQKDIKEIKVVNDSDGEWETV